MTDTPRRAERAQPRQHNTTDPGAISLLHTHVTLGHWVGEERLAESYGLVYRIGAVGTSSESPPEIARTERNRAEPRADALERNRSRRPSQLSRRSRGKLRVGFFCKFTLGNNLLCMSMKATYNTRARYLQKIRDSASQNKSLHAKFNFPAFKNTQHILVFNLQNCTIDPRPTAEVKYPISGHYFQTFFFATCNTNFF